MDDKKRHAATPFEAAGFKDIVLPEYLESLLVEGGHGPESSEHGRRRALPVEREVEDLVSYLEREPEQGAFQVEIGRWAFDYRHLWGQLSEIDNRRTRTSAKLLSGHA